MWVKKAGKSEWLMSNDDSHDKEDDDDADFEDDGGGDVREWRRSRL